MALDRLLIVVDGPTETNSLKDCFEKLFYACPSIRLGPGNGETFTASGYAQGVCPTLMLELSSNTRAVILIPDREKRKVASADFASTLKTEIINLLLNETQFGRDYLEKTIHVCPPDIMFENWIVSDVEGIKNNNSLINQDSKQDFFDGKNGAKLIGNMMVSKYKKTVHGPFLFKKTRHDISCQHSPSFKIFIECFNDMKQKHCQ